MSSSIPEVSKRRPSLELEQEVEDKKLKPLQDEGKVVEQNVGKLEDKRQKLLQEIVDEKDVDKVSDIEYYFSDGYRRVKPYYFTYMTYVKGRWVGKTIYDVFCSEFRDQSNQYYEEAIRLGNIKVDGKKVDKEFVLNHSMKVSHRIHRHEPPVPNIDIKIVYRDEEFLVVDKPSGLPVHPSGRYRFNTLQHLLEKYHSVPKFYPCNRLDRLTSGIVLIALNPNKAQLIERQLKERSVYKQYLTKVEGNFQSLLDSVSTLEEFNLKLDESGYLDCSLPLITYDGKLALNKVDLNDGKPSQTLFKFIKYNSTDNTSLIRCVPKTGRTHQIRVHLSHIGYPIVNDPLYNPKVKDHRLDVQEDDEVVKQVCTKCGFEIPNDVSLSSQILWLHARCYSILDMGFVTLELPDWIKN